MIAEVIPYTRTIRGKDAFDYAIPDSLDVREGDIVEVVFRSQKIFGLVRGLKTASEAKRLQSIGAVLLYPHWRAVERRNFLEWFAGYYAVSLPTAFRALQFPLLKRPRKTLTVDVVEVHAQEARKTQVSVEAAKQIVAGKTHLVRFDQRKDCIELYRSVVAKTDGHVLLIVPELVDAMALQFAFADSRSIHILSSDASPSEWNSVVELLAADKPILCIGTKRSVFLPFHLFSAVIMDSEESRSHKQFDLNPRYHVRTVLEWLEQHATPAGADSPTIIFASQAPSVDCAVRSAERNYIQIHLERKELENHVTVVDMADERQRQNYSWFSEALVEAVRNSKKSLLFLNRLGFYGSALCKDCSTLLPSTATQCTACKGGHIQYMRKGTAQLEKELHALFPGKTILRIDRDQHAGQLTSAAVQKADIIIGTEKVLHMLPLSYFDCIGVLSVDHLLVYPHFRSNERVYQLLVALCSIPVPTIVQTSAPHHPVIRAAVQNAYDAFVAQEVPVRKMLALPPFGERIVLLNTKTRETRVVKVLPPLEQLSQDIVVDRQ